MRWSSRTTSAKRRQLAKDLGAVWIPLEKRWALPAAEAATQVRGRARGSRSISARRASRAARSLPLEVSNQRGRAPTVFVNGRPALLCRSAPEAYGFTAPILAQTFFPSGKRPLHSQTFAVFAVAFALRPVGGASFGTLGDRIGRKRVLLLTV